MRRIADLAYPGAAEPSLESLVKDHLFEALADSELKFRVWHRKQITVEETIQAAVELYAYKLSEKKNTMVRSSQHTAPDTDENAKDEDEENADHEKLRDGNADCEELRALSCKLHIMNTYVNSANNA